MIGPRTIETVCFEILLFSVFTAFVVWLWVCFANRLEQSRHCCGSCSVGYRCFVPQRSAYSNSIAETELSGVSPLDTPSANRYRMFLIPCSCGTTFAIAEDFDRRGMHIRSF